MQETLQGLHARARTDERKLDLEEQLAVPDFPEAVRYLWKAFMRIRHRMGAGMSGPLPIAWPDLAAYTTLSGQRLAPWEIEVIEALDDAWLASTMADDVRA